MFLAGGLLLGHGVGEGGTTTNELWELCGNQSCTVLHRGADHATGAPANLLMQLKFHPSARDCLESDWGE